MSGEGRWDARLGFTPGLGRPTRPEPIAAEQTQGSGREGRRGGLLGGQPRVSATFSSVLVTESPVPCGVWGGGPAWGLGTESPALSLCPMWPV